MALALAEDGDQHIRAGDLLATGRLHVDDRALDHTLEAGGRLRVFAVIDDEGSQFVVHVVREGGAQRPEFDIARPHHAGGFFVIDQTEEQMLQRRVLMFALVRVGDGAMQGFFELARK